MKKCIRVVAVVTLVVVAVSCKKQYSSGNAVYPPSERKIHFQLYTNQDFSGNTSVISFSIFIRNADKTLFDSALAPIRIEDIPDALDPLVIEKTVKDNSDLAAGFRYDIQGVGTSSFIDTSKAGNPFKIVDYPFQ